MRPPQCQRTRCRSLGVSPTAFIAHPPDLQPWPLMDMDFATSCPLVRPALPHIRFLFFGSRLCSMLPPDSPSRFCPCALLVLHLHQVAQGLSPPELSDMSDTQDAAANAAAPAEPAQSVLVAENFMPSRSAFTDFLSRHRPPTVRRPGELNDIEPFLRVCVARLVIAQRRAETGKPRD